MRARIFICYRSADTLELARYLYGRLEQEFGKQNVFFGETSIPKGVDFSKRLKERIKQANIVIILIGDQWVQILNERYENKAETDWVSYELKTALQKGPTERIIPVIEHNAPIPRASDLPPNIPRAARNKFHYLNMLKLSEEESEREEQINKLIEEITDWEKIDNPALPQRKPPPHSGHTLWGKLLTAFALLSFILSGVIILAAAIPIFFSGTNYTPPAFQTADFRTFPLVLATICEYIPMSCIASGEIGNFVNRLDLPVTFGLTTTLSLWMGGLTFVAARALKIYKYHDPSLSLIFCLILSALVFVQGEFFMGLFVMYAMCMLLMVTSSEFEVEILQIAFVVLGFAGVVLLNQIQSSGEYVSPLVQVAAFAPLVTLSTKLVTKSVYLAVILGIVTSLLVYSGNSASAIEFLRDIINSLMNSGR